MSYRYFAAGKDGRRFCFDVRPTFSCPLAQPPVEFEGAAARADWDRLLEASAHLGCEPDKLARMIRRAHQRQTAERQRVEGHLTSLCSICGSVMERRGFRCWIEGPPPRDASDSQRATAEMNRRLFGGPGFVQLEGPWFQPTRKDATEWARMRKRETEKAA